MFDSYSISPSVHVSSSIHANIKEQRAPTDESVRLLREMEDKAKGEIVKSVRVQNTSFDGVIHSMCQPIDMTTLYRCIFKLNGKQLSVDYIAYDIDDMESRMIGIRNAVAQEIANQILTPIISSIRE